MFFFFKTTGSPLRFLLYEQHFYKSNLSGGRDTRPERVVKGMSGGATAPGTSGTAARSAGTAAGAAGTATGAAGIAAEAQGSWSGSL